MITIKYYGRLGNNLNQYAFGRILANRYKYCLNCRGVKGFINTNEKIDGQIIKDPVIGLKFNRVVLSELDKRINDTKGAHIHLYGTFGYYLNFEQHRDEIRKWFYLPELDLKEMNGKFKNVLGKEICVNDIDNNDVFLHIRLGDLLDTDNRRKYRTLFFDYYDIILSRIKFNRLFIASDSIESEYVRAFAKYNPILLFEDSVLKTLQFFKLFNRIIMSRSSFAWWGAYLSDAKEVYYPLPIDGLWGEDNLRTDCDYMVNESRYIYVRERTKEFITDYNKARQLLKCIKE